MFTILAFVLHFWIWTLQLGVDTVLSKFNTKNDALLFSGLDFRMYFMIFLYFLELYAQLSLTSHPL